MTQRRHEGEMKTPMLDWACLSFIKTVSAGSGVPKEIADKEDFTRLLPRAIEVRIVRAGDSAKVKLRTRDALYTFKTTSEEADSLTKGTKVPIQELGQTK